MKLEEIQDLIKFVSKSGVTCVEIEQKDFKITIKTEKKEAKPQYMEALPTAAPAPVQAAPALAPAPVAKEPTPAKEVESKYITINSPMIGTFYRSSGPDKGPFINVGDEVAPGKIICIVEAMKLFNEIEAEISGKIIKILVDDASPVEYDQPLLLIDPS
jgi:acetyl-CoA carboxylase biotin carboxyl carrier protein